MDIGQVLELIRRTSGCTVLAPTRLPQIGQGYVLPADLREFYEKCGGIVLFEDAEYTATIVPPERVVPANPVIVGKPCEEDISAAWHIIVDDGNGDYLTIDLSLERNGRCYDSFFDRHAVRGSCPIVAMSFADLLERLFWNQGQHWYWLRPGFISLGDAYDY